MTPEKIMGAIESLRDEVRGHHLSGCASGLDHLEHLERIVLRHSLCDCLDADCRPCRVTWPCFDVQDVIEQLQSWGELSDG